MDVQPGRDNREARPMPDRRTKASASEGVIGNVLPAVAHEKDDAANACASFAGATGGSTAVSNAHWRQQTVTQIGCPRSRKGASPCPTGRRHQPWSSTRMREGTKCPPTATGSSRRTALATATEPLTVPKQGVWKVNPAAAACGEHGITKLLQLLQIDSISRVWHVRRRRVQEAFGQRRKAWVVLSTAPLHAVPRARELQRRT